ncbi:hypothetical protein ERJ75_000042300 [Trypanosoma vivax]|uniref:Paraflagellar rod component n=1 Tax=Trypanosoma vivax (strain Y486) TaxID=1055687 RepID=G0U7H2_TRYVY|nr:hypothetical protein TRVL_05144 [Trypanosoma vivax]KAH8620685.1 hypothetical protein ERJ75_000042300 [Trypanosoma vivax]CCC51830.1 conserved hypothetical protein [Trypanosoma vivax Y486]
MNLACNSVAPLSPFMWSSPHVELVPAGFTPGTVADTMLHFSDLTFSLDALARVVEDGFHPISQAVDTHPLHRGVVHKRQFDVMRYGMVLDEAERLVLIEAPGLCGDTGKVVSREYNALFEEDFNSSPCAHHPVLPEYCFIVYQMPEKSEGGNTVPTPLFRLVFRNESFNENIRPDLVDKFPLFRLRSVYVSHTTYYPLHKQLQLYARALVDGANFSASELEEDLGLGPVRSLFDSWLLVLDGIAPSWIVDKGVGPDIVNMFLSSHRAEGRHDVQEALDTYKQSSVDNRVRCSYLFTGQRMRQRVNVMARSPNMLNTWRQGAYDIRYFSEVASTAEPTGYLAKCYRMLLCRRKPGKNSVDDDEIATFIPTDEECQPLQIYNTLAAERLRLWVLKGLLTAELHGVHNLLVEFDTAMVVAQCVGLLWGGGEEDRQREVLFHVCKIIVETVEDYVQHSGVIWRVIIVTSDTESVKSAKLCQDILEVTQMAKTRVEIEERQRVISNDEVSADKIVLTPSEDGITVHEDVKETSVPSPPPTNAVVEVPAVCTSVVVNEWGTVCSDLLIRTPKYTDAIMDSAARCGLRLADSDLYPIFLALSEGKETVPVSTVVRLIMEKHHQKRRSTQQGRPGTGSSLFWPHDHPICPIDCCIVPCDEEGVTNFVKSFQRKPYRARGVGDFRSTIRPSSSHAGSDALNYVEFSVLMLALARQ